MGNWLKQSTAVTISFGPFVSPTDAVTLQTGLVSAIDHASTGILLSKNGGALTIRHASVTASTYDAYGNYIVTLDTTDTNTLGRLRVQFAAAASCLPVWRDYEVVAANVWDSLVGGGDVLDVSLIQWLGTAPLALSSQLVQIANSAGVTTILADYARRTGDYATVAALSTLQGNVTTILADYARRTGDYSVLTAALVWAYSTRTLTSASQVAAVTAALVNTSKIVVYRGTTWSIALTDVGALTGYSKLYFTVKKHESDTDAQALLQIEIAGGLSVLNGATYGTAANGSITVDDAATGDVTITVKPAATSALQPATNLYFDFKSVISSVVTVNAAGTLTIASDITRAVS